MKQCTSCLAVGVPVLHPQRVCLYCHLNKMALHSHGAAMFLICPSQVNEPIEIRVITGLHELISIRDLLTKGPTTTRFCLPTNPLKNQ